MPAENTIPTRLPIRLYRLTRLLLHFIWGALLSGLYFPLTSESRKSRVIQRWSAQLLTILHIRLQINNLADTPELGCLVAANHISWLDIWVLNAWNRVHFVSKAEVRDWPLIGWLAQQAGTFFIQRHKRHDTARINRQVTHALQQGARVAFFPEGTTTDGSQLKPFHPSLLQPAIEAPAPLQPVTLNYRNRDGSRNQAVAYHDDTTLGQSLWRTLSCREIIIELQVLPVIMPTIQTRRELAWQTEAAIAGALGLPLPHRKPGTPPGPPDAQP